MKFLKVLINSLISGLFFSILLSILILDLNINLDFRIFFFGQVTLFLAITYGLLISLLCLVLFFIFQFISGKNIQLAVISPSFLSISFSLLIALFLVLFKTNQDYYLSFFGPEIKSLLKTQTVILIFLAIIGPIAFYGFRRYKKNAYFFWTLFLPSAPIPTSPQPTSNTVAGSGTAVRGGLSSIMSLPQVAEAQ